MIEEKLLNRLIERQAQIEKSICEFPASDFSSYLKRVGEWQGIQVSINELMSLKKLDDNED